MTTPPPHPESAPSLADLAGPTPPDLLPPEYRRAIHRRGVLRRRAVMLLGTLLVILPFIYRAAGERSDLIDRRAHLIDAADAGRMIAEQLPRLQAEYDDMVRVASLIERHNPPIDYSQVIASIGRTLSTADALREVRMRTVRRGDEASDGAARGADRPRIDVAVTMVSPTEAESGRLIERLSRLPILDRFEADAPAPGSLDGLAASLVRSRAAVPLDRSYTPIPSARAIPLEQVSDAAGESDLEVRHAAP